MSTLVDAMRFYAFAFHPVVVLFGTAVALVYLEWRRQPDPGRLRRRYGVLAVAVAASLLPPAGYLAATSIPVRALLRGRGWAVDALTGISALVAGAVVLVVWPREGWGDLLPGAVVTVLAGFVPYVALSAVWNVSGHVTFTALPTAYLALADRRFRPALAVPAVMVVNRPLLGQHTWLQSVAGVALAAAVFVALSRVAAWTLPGR